MVFVIFRVVTNRYLIVQPPRGQDVEWGYCFDIHLNAFFPLLMILHFFQLPFLNSTCISVSSSKYFEEDLRGQYYLSQIQGCKVGHQMA